MVLWQGKGFLAVVFLLVSAISTEWVINRLFGAGYHGSRPWTFIVVGVVAGIPTFLVGQALRKPKRVIDPHTGMTHDVRGPHTLFFIPLVYWGPILAIIYTIVGFTR